MHVSKEIDYGLQIMMVLAKHGPISSKDVAETYKIPHNFVQLILPKLTRSGLVEWIPKTKNIYQLNKSAREITFLQIIETLNGPIDLLDRQPAKQRINEEFFTPMVHLWEVLQKDVGQYLSKITLDQVIREALSPEF